MRLGYENVNRFPYGYFGWQERYEPDAEKRPATQIPVTGQSFPACRLMLLDSDRDRPYLGIPRERQPISLSDIKCDYLLIELYNEQCFGCLDAVKTLKGLFDRLEENKKTRGRVKIIGIGVGSKKRHVAKFRKEHHIPFPLFADEKKEISECLNAPALPTVYLARKTPAGGHEILWFHTGHIENTEALANRIALTVSGNHSK